MPTIGVGRRTVGVEVSDSEGRVEHGGLWLIHSSIRLEYPSEINSNSEIFWLLISKFEIKAE